MHYILIKVYRLVYFRRRGSYQGRIQDFSRGGGRFRRLTHKKTEFWWIHTLSANNFLPPSEKKSVFWWIPAEPQGGGGTRRPPPESSHGSYKKTNQSKSNLFSQIRKEKKTGWFTTDYWSLNNWRRKKYNFRSGTPLWFTWFVCISVCLSVSQTFMKTSYSTTHTFYTYKIFWIIIISIIFFKIRLCSYINLVS